MGLTLFLWIVGAPSVGFVVLARQISRLSFDRLNQRTQPVDANSSRLA
jgi:hypothetical protein